MRLTFTTEQRTAMGDIDRAAAELAKWQRMVTSGRRILAPSDDPAAMARTVVERAEMGTLDQYARAADSVGSRLAIVDTVLSDIVSLVTSARTAAASARGTTATASAREAAARDLEGIRDSLLSDLSTRFQGTYLFSGSATLTAPFTKLPDGTVSSYQGDQNPMSVDVDRVRAVEVTFDGLELVKGSDTQDLFTTLDALAAAVRAADQDAIDAGLQALERAFDRAVVVQTRVGLSLATLDHTRVQLTALKQASAAQLSEDEDANMVDAISRMNQAETAYRAALAAVGMRSQLSLLDFLR